MVNLQISMDKKQNDSIFTNKSSAGKGDKPRNISKSYYENYSEIDWSAHKKRTDEKKVDFSEKTCIKI